MKNKKVLGIAFFITLLVTIFCAVNNPNSICVGDVIFRKLGLKAWTNDTKNLGTHYSSIYLLILAGACYLGVFYNLKTIYPKFTKNLPWILLIIIIIYPKVFINTTKAVKSFSNGLDAVYYYRDESNCGYRSYNDRYLRIQGNLILQNCGDDEIEFGIKVIPSKTLVEEGIFVNKPIVIKDKISKNERFFILSPGEKQNIKVMIDKVERKNLSYLRGSLKDPNIILFNNEEEKVFKKY